MPSASSWMAARTMSSTLRLWPEVNHLDALRLDEAPHDVDRRIMTVE